MKKICLILILIICAVFLLSCYPGNADYYESRFDELDINGRVNEAAKRIEEGHISAHLKKELEIIISDLSRINTHDDPTLKEINSGFISAVKMLYIAAEQREQNSKNYITYYNMAKKEFSVANGTLDQYKKNEDYNRREEAEADE